MRAALGHPALCATAGVGALLGLTWPLLVFDRPLYVVVGLFAAWSLVILVIFILSGAPEPDATHVFSDAPPSEGASDRGN